MNASPETVLEWTGKAPPSRKPEKSDPPVSAKSFLKIAELDTTVASENLGDQIIMEASRATLRKLFPDAFYISLTTHEFLLWESYRMLRGCDYVFVGGSNLLKSSMLWNNQWKISPLDFLFRRNCILMGCGWWHYQAAPNLYSRLMLRRILARQHMHSVRDHYAQQQLRAAGIHNVLNTACITMWNLNHAHCERIPTEPARQVVTTVTAYNADVEADRLTMQALFNTYEQVWLWPQQPADIEYGLHISGGRAQLLPPNVKAYTDFMQTNHVDYVGSRLHGGIRALQTGKRSLILGVDNRALEIQRDTGLPVVRRGDMPALQHWLTTSAPTHIQLPTAAIDQWQAQFAARRESAVSYG